MRKVFVKSLPLSCDKGQLAASMEAFGPVDKSFVLYNHKDGCSRGFGFVEFCNINSAEKAAAQGKIQISGKFAIVERAIAKNEITGGFESEVKHVSRTKAARKLPSTETSFKPKSRIKTKSSFEEESNSVEGKSYPQTNNQGIDQVTSYVHKQSFNFDSAAKADELECVTCGSFKATTPEYHPIKGQLAKEAIPRCIHLPADWAGELSAASYMQYIQSSTVLEPELQRGLEGTNSVSPKLESTCAARLQHAEEPSESFLGLTFKDYLKAGGPCQHLAHSSSSWSQLRFNRQVRT